MQRKASTVDDYMNDLVDDRKSPMSKLKKTIMKVFAGQTLGLNEIYEQHSVGTPYLKKNYREVLKALETAGEIEVFSIKGKRRIGTYPEHVKIRFPKNG